MLVACWSAKGGAGTTVVACSIALVLARDSIDPPTLLVDLAGDVPATLGLADPAPGIGEWLSAGGDVGADAIRRLAVDAMDGLGVVGAGSAPAGDVAGARVGALADALRSLPGRTVVDCGVIGASAAGDAVAASADLSLLVVRPCYVSLRRALAAPVRPDAVILVAEPERSLGRRDVEDVLGVEVRAEIDVDPAVARATDAGLLAARLPRHIERALREAA